MPEPVYSPQPLTQAEAIMKAARHTSRWNSPMAVYRMAPTPADDIGRCMGVCPPPHFYSDGTSSNRTVGNRAQIVGQTQLRGTDVVWCPADGSRPVPVDPHVVPDATPVTKAVVTFGSLPDNARDLYRLVRHVMSLQHLTEKAHPLTPADFSEAAVEEFAGEHAIHYASYIAMAMEGGKVDVERSRLKGTLASCREIVLQSLDARSAGERINLQDRARDILYGRRLATPPDIRAASGPRP